VNVLLISPQTYTIYAGTSWYRRDFFATTPLGLLCLAGPLIKNGHKVKVLDMNILPGELDGAVRSFHPDLVGITSLTATIGEAKRVAHQVKSIDRQITVAIGGPHATVMVEDVADCEDFDKVVTGEADLAILSLMDNKDRVIHCGMLSNMENVPIPPYELLGDPSRYKTSKMVARNSPVAMVETSRGCYGRCTFCAKQVQGHKMRFKSIDRMIEELLYLQKLGYREIQFADYTMAADKKRVVELCERMIAAGLKLSWHPSNGIRVDNADLEMFKLMKKAGCYKISFGVESGSQRILNSVNKQINIGEIKRAVDLAKKAKLETCGFFMMAIPGETEEDLVATINLAVELDFDMVRYPNLIIPYPGTEMTRMMNERGYISCHDWSKYNAFTPARDFYDEGARLKYGELPWDTIVKYQKLFYLKCHGGPLHALKRIIRLLRTGKWQGFVEVFMVKLGLLRFST
jgi:anaerobic magnesium-protoporphyrin IX monomethyl ester cyclase